MRIMENQDQIILLKNKQKQESSWGLGVNKCKHVIFEYIMNALCKTFQLKRLVHCAKPISALKTLARYHGEDLGHQEGDEN